MYICVIPMSKHIIYIKTYINIYTCKIYMYMYKIYISVCMNIFKQKQKRT